MILMFYIVYLYNTNQFQFFVVLLYYYKYMNMRHEDPISRMDKDKDKNRKDKQSHSSQSNKSKKQIERSRQKAHNGLKDKEKQEKQIKKENIITQNNKKEQQGQSDIDMFADEVELNVHENTNNQKQKEIVRTDQSGYYLPIIGTILVNKYKIVDKLGKGVFGLVVKVLDLQDNQKPYAIKILRKNKITQASGHQQYKILTQIQEKRKLKRIMKVFDIFQEHGHVCITCELLSTDLRSFSHKKQPTLADIRIYAIGMFLISNELRISKIIHADIKPDNFLFKSVLQIKPNQELNQRFVIDNLKLADFGTSFSVQEYKSNVQEQVARYYRAPQIILGTKIKHSEVYAIDVWAMGCSLYELYTNQFLFNGSTNNEMLKLMMETKGKFNIKMLNKSEFVQKHFDSDYNFLYQYVDKITKEQKIQKMQVNVTAQRDLMNLLKKYGKNQNPKQVQNFRDFLERCLTLNPKDRITPQQAIQHPFLHFQTKLDL